MESIQGIGSTSGKREITTKVAGIPKAPRVGVFAFLGSRPGLLPGGPAERFTNPLHRTRAGGRRRLSRLSQVQ